MLKMETKLILVPNLLFLVIFMNRFCAGERQPQDGLPALGAATAGTAARQISPTVSCLRDIQNRPYVTKHDNRRQHFPSFARQQMDLGKNTLGKQYTVVTLLRM